MQYFTAEFNGFFKELAANNNKDWFDENRKRYQKHVREPFVQFTFDLIDAIKVHEPNLHLEPKNAIFRINNDIRFHKNKPLYKTHMGATISNSGRKNMQTPGFYIQLSPGECMIAMGCYKPEKDILLKIRQGIANAPDEFSELITNKEFVKTFGALGESEVNRILPKELKEAAENQPLLYNKQFYVVQQFDDGERFILNPNILSKIMNTYTVGKSLNDFLKACINP